MKKDIVLDDFIKALPFEWSDKDLLKKVFVHRSFLNEKDGAGLESNERLEFLGDAILSNAISQMLYERFPSTDEGELTRMRARLVNRQTLARIARELTLPDYLLLGKGERMGGGKENPMILAGVFEALIAAIYLERGFQASFAFIDGLFTGLAERSFEEHGHFDSKPRLQELSQRLFKEAPVYRLVADEGPPHKKTFDVEVVIAGKALGTGRASKKKDAEQLAAAAALRNLTERLKDFFPEKEGRTDGA